MPNGPRRKAENMSSPVPVSASICAGFMGTRQASSGPKAMRLPVLALLLALSPAVLGGETERPGYGVVQSVTPLRQAESASAGASVPAARRGPAFLVRVRMEDGSIQIREVKKRRFSAGDRVLLTNAGDVVPD